MNPLDEIKDELAKATFGMTRAEALMHRLCINCKKTPRYYTDGGRREYSISGLCEFCFDLICQDPSDFCKECEKPPSFHRHNAQMGECSYFIPKSDVGDIFQDED